MEADKAEKKVSEHQKSLQELTDKYPIEANQLATAQHKAERASPVAEVLTTQVADLPKQATAIVTNMDLPPQALQEKIQAKYPGMDPAHIAGLRDMFFELLNQKAMPATGQGDIPSQPTQPNTQTAAAASTAPANGQKVLPEQVPVPGDANMEPANLQTKGGNDDPSRETNAEAAKKHKTDKSKAKNNQD